jgi:hypothetical protein
MNPQDAGELVHTWVNAHEDPAEMSPHSGPVSRTLRELAPDGRPNGLAQTPTGPAMVVMLEDALLVFQARPLAAAADQVMPVRVRLVRLDETTELEVTERYEERAGGSTLRLHVWQLRAGGLDLRVEGGQVVEAGAAPDLNEQLGRAVAAQLGWTLP